MKVKIFILFFLISVFLISCKKEEDFQPPLDQQKTLHLSEDVNGVLIIEPDSSSNNFKFSGLGDYSQLDTNNYWKYENHIIIRSDYPPFNKDTIKKTFEERFVGDTIYDFKQFLRKNDSTFYHYSNGEYFKIDCNTNEKCFYYKYLDENLDTGSTWFSDTLQLPGEIFTHKEVSIVSKKSDFEVCGVVYDEVIKVKESYLYQDSKNVAGTPLMGHYINYHYAKDYGLIKKEIKIPNNMTDVTCLVEFGLH